MENVNVIDERRSKSLKTECSIAICRPTGDKWQSKTLFLAIFNPRSMIVKERFRLPPIRYDIGMMPQILNHQCNLFAPSEYCSCGELHRCMPSGNGYFYIVHVLTSWVYSSIRNFSHFFLLYRLGPSIYCHPPPPRVFSKHTTVSPLSTLTFVATPNEYPQK